MSPTSATSRSVRCDRGSRARAARLTGPPRTGVFPAHVSDDQKLDKAVSMLTGLRSYLLYHIKASKSYLHTRMRRYIVTMQQGTPSRLPSASRPHLTPRIASPRSVLNRAVPEAEHGEKRTKTASGKTFVRR